MIVVVGSRNRTKIDAARAVFQKAWPQCEVRGASVDIPESISAMPTGDQVREGARFRARSVLVPGIDLGVGAEGGVSFVGDDAYLFNWCVVAAASGLIYESPSPRVLLPPQWGLAVRQGHELGPIVAEWAGIPDVNQGLGAIGLLTRGLLNRQSFFEQALLCAIAPLLTPDLYSMALGGGL